ALVPSLPRQPGTRSRGARKNRALRAGVLKSLAVVLASNGTIQSRRTALWRDSSPHDQRYYSQDQEDDEEDLADLHGAGCYAAKAKQRRYQCDDEENDCPSQHVVLNTFLGWSTTEQHKSKTG